MIVALGTLEGESQPGAGGGCHPVDGTFDAVLLLVSAALAVAESLAVESGGKLLPWGGLGQEVACELLSGELVKRHVVVDGLDDPVAPEPGIGAGVVLFISVAIRIARLVEPVASPSFAEMRRSEEAVDGCLEAVLRILLPGIFENMEFVESRGQADEGKVETAEKTVWRCGRGGGDRLLRKPGENETVDFVVAPVLVGCRGRSNRLQGAVGPVFRPGRALTDPVPEEGDLLPGKGCLGRHSFVRIVMSKALVEFAFLGSARYDEGFARFSSL